MMANLHSRSASSPRSPPTRMPEAGCRSTPRGAISTRRRGTGLDARLEWMDGIAVEAAELPPALLPLARSGLARLRGRAGARRAVAGPDRRAAGRPRHRRALAARATGRARRRPRGCRRFSKVRGPPGRGRAGASLALNFRCARASCTSRWIPVMIRELYGYPYAHRSLFAGVGGSELGTHWAGHQTELLCDVLHHCNARGAPRALPGVEYRHDITRLRSLPSAVDGVRRFPCQDLSQAGAPRAGGPAFGPDREVFRLLSRRRVPTVVVENVPFMLQLNGGKAMRAIVDEFERRKYRWPIASSTLFVWPGPAP